MVSLEAPRSLAGSAARIDPWGAVGLSRAGFTRFLGRAQAELGLRGEVDVLLTGDRMLRRLNREFRGKDKATDVLSFPSSGLAPAAEGLEREHAGDLAISLEIASNQAAAFGHSLRDEVRVLMLHGLLHLAGMDHETDNGEMAAREAALRKTLRLPGSLIARASNLSSPSAAGQGSNRTLTRPRARKAAQAKSSGRARGGGLG